MSGRHAAPWTHMRRLLDKSDAPVRGGRHRLNFSSTHRLAYPFNRK